MSPFVIVLVVIVVGLLAVGAWVDHEARKRGSKLASSAEMGRAIKAARREARSSRSRLHIGSGRALRSPTNPERPSWDDRPR